MNIKSIANTLLPANMWKTEPATQDMKPHDASKDRESDGRRDEESHPQKRHLTSEEAEQAVENLKKLDGIVNHSLSVRLVTQGKVQVALIEDPQGQVIRRLPESDLWLMLIDESKKTGHILNKGA